MTARLWPRNKSIIDRTLAHLALTLQKADQSPLSGNSQTLLFNIDPRVKLIGTLLLLGAVISCIKVSAIVAVLCLAAVLARSSSVSFGRMAVPWFGVLLFTVTIALPEVFLVPGPILGRVPLLAWPISQPGLENAIYLLLRSETTLTLSLLLVLTTRWNHLLRALRTVGVPPVAIILISMTHRYIFLLIDSAQEMLQSRRSRIVSKLSSKENRRLMVSTAGVLLGKTSQLSDDVYLAMRSRGYRGAARIMDEFEMRSRDWAALLVFFVAAAILCAGGR